MSSVPSNFWIQADINQRESVLCGGPEAETPTGKMGVRFFQRAGDEIVQPINLSARSGEDGKLVTFCNAHQRDGIKVSVQIGAGGPWVDVSFASLRIESRG